MGKKGLIFSFFAKFLTKMYVNSKKNANFAS